MPGLLPSLRDDSALRGRGRRLTIPGGLDTLRCDLSRLDRREESYPLIKQVHFKNYKLLRDVRMDLGPLNLVVGRNGIGKSSIIEGIHGLLQTSTVRHKSPLFGPQSIERFGSRPDARDFELGVSLDDGTEFSISLARPSKLNVHFTMGGGTHDTGTRLPLTKKHDSLFEGPFAAKLGEVVRLKLHSESLLKDSPIGEEPRVEFDGEGLPSALWEVLARRDGTLAAIESDLAALVKGAKRVRVIATKVPRKEMIKITVGEKDIWAEQTREVSGAHLDVEFEHIGWIPADQLSEGTLLLLGLITMLRFRPPRLVLLDDIDKALHPLAQRELLKLLRKILESRDGLQVLATSHSPFVLDEARAEEVFIVGHAGPGTSQVRRLDAHPAWSKRGEFMHPGEFWSAVGEDWVGESTR